MSSESIHKRSAELTLIEVKENGFCRVTDPESCVKKVKKYTGIELEICDHMLRFKKKNMKKFAVTRLSELKTGDRFYLPKHKNKICEYCGFKKEVFETTYCYFDHNQDIINTTINLKVVYLRNIND